MTDTHARQPHLLDALEKAMDEFLTDALDPEYIIRERLHIEIEQAKATHTSATAPVQEITWDMLREQTDRAYNKGKKEAAKAAREQTLQPIGAIHERFKHLDDLLSKRDPDCPMMMCYVDIWEAVKESLRAQQQEQP